AYTVAENNTLTVSAPPGVLANDTDADNDPLTAALVTGPSHGWLNLNADGSFTYVPADYFNGTDTFTYRANDGTLDSNLATVTITVNPIDDAPIANDDSFNTTPDTALAAPAPGVLGIDVQPDGRAVTAVPYSTPQATCAPLQ